jgi:2-keto-4-pentenoate hydratase/2-oxohepta-3-ene-1,7-dioic acid hydratase in catechol pathway
MRRVRFRDIDGRARTGEWTDAGIEYSGQLFDPAEVDVLPPTEPSKIVGVSTNHEDLIEERDDLEWPDRPKLFVKTPNCVVGHRDTVKLIPDKEFSFEGEIAAVIGEQCKNVDAADAMDVVSGFTCMNEISNHTDKDTYAARRKATDDMAPTGPVVASPDRVPADASIELRIDGEARQQSDRSRYIFGLPEIIEEITTYFTLEVGDVVPMGSPPGPAPLSDGDHVEVEIEGVGTLEHDVSIDGPPA